MMIMRSPREGQGCESVSGSLPSAGSAVTASLSGFGTLSRYCTSAVSEEAVADTMKVAVHLSSFGTVMNIATAIARLLAPSLS